MRFDSKLDFRASLQAALRGQEAMLDRIEELKWWLKVCLNYGCCNSVFSLTKFFYRSNLKNIHAALSASNKDHVGEAYFV